MHILNSTCDARWRSLELVYASLYTCTIYSYISNCRNSKVYLTSNNTCRCIKLKIIYVNNQSFNLRYRLFQGLHIYLVLYFLSRADKNANLGALEVLKSHTREEENQVQPRTDLPAGILGHDHAYLPAYVDAWWLPASHPWLHLSLSTPSCMAPRLLEAQLFDLGLSATFSGLEVPRVLLK